MIQKNMYFFWGNKTMSWMRYMTLFSFRKLNPDWEMVLYLCKPSKIRKKTWLSSPTQDFFTFTGKDYFPRVKELDIRIEDWDLEDLQGRLHSDSMGPSHKSNFFKWEKLSTVSGFYSDLDILYVKPLKEYYNKVKTSDLVACYNTRYFSIGFLGSSGDNKFYRDIYNNTFENFTLDGYQSAGVRNVYNWFNRLEFPGSTSSEAKRDLWEKLKQYYPQIKCYNNPMAFVYPWTAMKMAAVFEKRHTKLPNDCFGIHWYAGHTISQKYNNLLTGQNYRDYKNTFSYFVGKGKHK